MTYNRKYKTIITTALICFSFFQANYSMPTPETNETIREREAREKREKREKIQDFLQGSAGIFNGDESAEAILNFLNEHEDKIEAVTQAAAKLGRHAINGMRHMFGSQERKIENEIKQINRKLATRIVKQSPAKTVRLRRKRERLEKKLEKICEENRSIINEMAKAGTNTANQIVADFAKERINRKDRENQRLFNVLEAKEKAKAKWKILTSKESAQRLSIALVGTLAGITTIYYGGKLGFNYLDAKIGKPTLVRESNRLSIKNSFLNLFRKKIVQNFSIDEVILEPKTQTTLYNFADEIKNTYENGLPFRHALFYGLPGTGKTMFAKAMAQHCGLDYAIMSGADFSQFKKGEGIVELHKLFDWAKNSRKGLLVFVDEADSFLRDRRVLDNEEKNLLNAFLSRTVTNNKKIIFVFATNYENELDPAVLSRIHKKIEFVLPSQDERVKILNMYFEKYIFNDKRKILKGNKKIEMFIEIPKNVNSDFINQISKQIEGFSGRDIEQLVSELRVAVYNQGDGVLSRNIINNSVQEKIKEHQHDMQASKIQRQRYEKALGIS